MGNSAFGMGSEQEPALWGEIFCKNFLSAAHLRRSLRGRLCIASFWSNLCSLGFFLAGCKAKDSGMCSQKVAFNFPALLPILVFIDSSRAHQFKTNPSNALLSYIVSCDGHFVGGIQDSWSSMLCFCLAPRSRTFQSLSRVLLLSPQTLTGFSVWLRRTM